MATVLEFYRNGVVVRHQGVVTDQEMLETERGIYSHAYPVPLEFQIADLSQVSDFRVSLETMRDVGRMDRDMARSLKRQHVAVIAPSQGRAMAIVWQAWATEGGQSSSLVTTKVNTISEAQDWLRGQGIDVDLNVAPDSTCGVSSGEQ